MMRVRMGLLAVVGGVVVGGQADAQVAGVYRGVNAQGSPIAVTVSQDQAGQFGITDVLIYYVAKCQHSSITLNQGDEGPLDAPINGGVASYAGGNIIGYYSYRLSFSGDGKTATGMATVIHSTVDTSNHDKLRPLYCIASDEPLNLSLQ